MKPWLLASDLHCHSWSAFATTGADGINSRLAMILSEMKRAAAELRAAGGDTIVLAGDLFHTRGAIDPEVFNPVHSTICELIDQGFVFYAIPGNHDLKGKETTELGNAMQSLGAYAAFNVVTEVCSEHIAGIGDVAFIPWCSTAAGLRAAVKHLQAVFTPEGIAEVDLIIHAGINGVLLNMPDHGLDSSEVASWGFRRVFAGHYHNHKIMEGGKVVSIGATTHQTWSDLNTKAGFLLVTDDDVTYRASQAPAFVEIDGDTPEEEIPLVVDGNYVRIRGMKMTDAEINLMREELAEMGARGSSFQVARELVSARSGTSSAPAKSLSLAVSVARYVDALEELPHKIAVGALCDDILSSVQSVKTT